MTWGMQRWHELDEIKEVTSINTGEEQYDTKEVNDRKESQFTEGRKAKADKQT